MYLCIIYSFFISLLVLSLVPHNEPCTPDIVIYNVFLTLIFPLSYLPVFPWFLFTIQVPTLTIRTSFLVKSFHYSEVFIQNLLCAWHCVRPWDSQGASDGESLSSCCSSSFVCVCTHVCVFSPFLWHMVYAALFGTYIIHQLHCNTVLCR